MRTALLLLALGLVGCRGVLGIDDPIVLDGGGLASIGFSLESRLEDEFSGEIAIPVVLSAPLGVDVSVRYEVSGGTAEDGDFSLAGDTLTIPAGTTLGAIMLTIVQDADDENDETIELTLSQPTGPVTLVASSHVVTISANSLPRVGFMNASTAVLEGYPVTINVMLDRASSVPVTVAYGTSGTATAGADFSPASGTITFPPGTTVQTFDPGAVDDPLDENDETVVITLANPENGIIGTQGLHTHTIIDGDPLPQLTFTTPSNAVIESAGNITVGVTLTPASGRTVTVAFERRGGVANTPQDYAFVTQSPLSIPPGTTSATITLSIVDDNTDEGSENLRLGLNNPLNASLGAADEHTLTINDND